MMDPALLLNNGIAPGNDDTGNGSAITPNVTMDPSSHATQNNITNSNPTVIGTTVVEEPPEVVEQDSNQLEKLHPSWLAAFDEVPECIRENVFYKSIFPLIAFRADWQQEQPCENQIRRWKIAPLPDPLLNPSIDFSEVNFNLQHAIERFNSHPIGIITELERLALGIHGAAINERLWIYCPEFYLLALAYSHLEHFNSRAFEDYLDNRMHDERQYADAYIDRLMLNTKTNKKPAYTKVRDGAKSSSKDEDVKFQQCLKAGIEEASEFFEFLVTSTGKKPEPSIVTPGLDDEESIPYQTQYPAESHESEYQLNMASLTRHYLPDYLKKLKLRRSITYNKVSPITYGNWRIDLENWQRVTALCNSDSKDQRWIGDALRQCILSVYYEGSRGNADVVRGPAGERMNTLCINIKTFCEHVGSPQISLCGLTNIANLRTWIANRTTHTATLYSKIEELQATNLEQKKIIEALSSRHVLESLPARTTPGSGSSGKWKTFWTNSWSLAEEREAIANANPNATPSDHPLATIMRLPNRDKRRIKQCGEELYGTLSHDIHDYHNGSVKLSNQWHKDERLIMDSLMAGAGVGGLNSEIDWDVLRVTFYQLAGLH